MDEKKEEGEMEKTKVLKRKNKNQRIEIEGAVGSGDSIVMTMKLITLGGSKESVLIHLTHV
jgi:hypothetical protein